MRIRTGLIVTAAASVVLFSSGCESMQSDKSSHVHVQPTVASKPVPAGSMAAANVWGEGGFALGAGDALGGVLFNRHVAFVYAAEGIEFDGEAERASASVPVVQ